MKTLIHVVDKKQVGIKNAIKIISSLNASQRLLVPDELKLVKLVLILSAANAVSKRSCSTFCRFKTYLRSSMARDV